MSIGHEGTNEAALSFNIFQGRGLNEDEITLGTPDDAEAKNLKHHTAKCAMRFRMFSSKLSEQAQDVQQIKIILLLVGGYLILVSEPAKGVLGLVLHLLGG